MTNQLKNPFFWYVVLFIAGMGIGAWGMIREDCIGGPNCWVGSGFLEWTGGIMLVGGIIGMSTSWRKKQ